MANQDQDNNTHGTPKNTQYRTTLHPTSSTNLKFDNNNPVLTVQQIQEQYQQITHENIDEEINKQPENQKTKNLLFTRTPPTIQARNKTLMSIPSSPPSLNHNFEPIYSENDINEKDYYSYPEPNYNTLNPNQFIVPTNLPMYMTGDKPITEIEQFTRMFALTLNAHGLNINTAWQRLLPLCIPLELQDWVLRTQAVTLTWKQIASNLIQQYGNPHRRREAIVKLYSYKYTDEESIMEYLANFLKLMRQAQISVTNRDMIDYIIEQLPVHISIQLEAGMQYNHIQHSVIEIEALARTFPGVNQKKHRVISNNNNNNNQNKRFNNYNTNNKSNTNTKVYFCSKHGNGNHSTDRCHTLQAANKKTGDSKNNSITTMTNTNTKNNKPIICFICNEPGHISTHCPNHEDQARARRTMLREHDTKLNNNTLDDYEIPIIVNNHSTTALLDTGASTSFITQDLVNKLNLFIIPVEGTIETAFPGHSISRIAITEAVSLTCGTKTIQTQLEVVKELNGPSIFIGSNIINKLDIDTNGLPFRTTNIIPLDEPITDEITPAVEQTTDSTNGITDIMINEAMATIAKDLQENENISPLEVCPLEMAVVKLNTPDNLYTHKRQYQIAEKMKPAMQGVIDEWINEKVIIRIKEPTQFNTPIFPIPKKDSTGQKTLCRPCMDFRALNDLIQADKYPLPLIHDIFTALNGNKYFSSLDLKSAYHRFPVLEEHQHKTAFTWEDIQYKFLRAPFGLKNLPSQFQRVIHYIFKDCSFVKTFIDDIIIFSETWILHIKHVKYAIQTLNNAKLILNIPKCHIFKTSLILLGFKINAYGHAIDKQHALKSVTWPTPTTGKQVQAFLGFINYFREHIPMISILTAPLDKLRNIQIIAPSLWTTEHQQSFNKLKEILMIAPTLAYPDFNNKFYIATDASNVGLGAVLYQYKKDTKIKQYVSFQSRSLTVAECNYSATKRELLGIVFALKKFHRYIWGTHFIIYTDHKALVYLHTQKHLSPMLINWYETIFDYNFTIYHKPGIKNVLPDALSRFFSERGNETELRSSITIRSITVTNNQDLTYKEKIQLLQKQHLLGHFGPDAIVKALKDQNITWSNILQDATDVTKACIQCIRYNITRHGYHPLKSIIANKPFDHLAIDLAGPFTTSNKNEHWLLVIIDIHSRFVLLRTLIDKSATSVADVLLKVFFDFGFPRILQSDNGTEFVNRVLKKITESACIDHRLITPYHPRANGAAERTVQTVKLLIYKLIKGIKKDWSLFVPFTQYCINNKIKICTKSTAFNIMFGRPANPLKDYSKQEPAVVDDDKIKQHALFMQQTLFPAIAEATSYVTELIEQRFNSKYKITEFINGTYVMIIDKERTKKSDPAHKGPYKIIYKNKGGAYVLMDLDGTILKRNYIPSELIPISNMDIFQDEVYEIETIINHRSNKNNEIEYLVKWKDYSDSHNSWEPFANFNSIKPIDKYWSKHNQTSPHIISTGGK